MILPPLRIAGRLIHQLDHNVNVGDIVKLDTLQLFPETRASALPVQCKDHSAKLAPFDLSEYADAPARPFYQSAHGALFDGDCLNFLACVRSEVVDTVFADPPFNLDKKYGSKSNDNLPEKKYIEWCKSWLDECIRVLRPGGSLYVYNLPRWNIVLGAFLMERGMTFWHDITVEVKSTLPLSLIHI